ncbi:MAG: DEAD/DEAH box helicase [Chlamydiales bacterium]|nr:DEAD/DEAH box helicase [Chlamydiales bacterium]
MRLELEFFRSDAERAHEKGFVREVAFSNATYQIEVFDPELNQSFWPFLQFDEQGELRDAFCSCSAEDEKGCVHLAAAYLKIFNKKLEPLHLRFEHSFWNAICSLSADHSGYEERFLKKEGEGKYRFEEEISFTIQAKEPFAKKLLKGWIEERPRETPENSIKFSNLSQEEIGWWRDGRPSPELRYLLSFWSDLAKWSLANQDKAKIRFEEGPEGLPTRLSVSFPEFIMEWSLQPEDLERWIPTLPTVEAPLKLFTVAEGKIESIEYDPKNHRFIITHAERSSIEEKGETKKIGKWEYAPGVGFFSKEGESLLSHSVVEREDISSLLEEHSEQISRFIPVNKTPVKLSYNMYFDADWNWHFAAYLFKKGDLQKPDSDLIDKWAYLHHQGFFAVEEVLFEETEKVLSPAKVSGFVNHHRIWLNGQEGFQTHLASIESHLTYSITKRGDLKFHTKTHTESNDSHDFGDWIHYSKLGFFSKKYARLGFAVRPGIEVPASAVSRFIRKNHEELEGISQFFTTRLPIEKRGLEITVKSQASIHVKPIYTGEKNLLFFGDFVYKEGEGFCELPIHMRLPEEYQEEKTVSHDRLAHFLEDDLPQLRKFIINLDTSLKRPLKTDLELDYLVRAGHGGLRAQFEFVTEHGRIPVSRIADGFEKRRRYLFTEGGLLDLHDQEFQWIRHLTHPVNPELNTIQLTTLEFIRIDATFSILGPPEGTPTSEITRHVLRDLREFTSHEKANTKGLQSELRLYQQTGLQWLWFLYKNGLSALLCDDMGLGKTHQAMALMAAALNHKEGEKRRFLVVCPTSVIYHWQDKLEMFLPKMKVYTFHGLKRSLNPNLKEGLILTTYGILRMEKETLEKIPFEVAVFDEIQVAKNPSSRVHEALRHVQARMRIGLTGTPIENNLRELKALFDLVLPGYMPSEARYREMFINPIERDLDEEKKRLLSQLIRPFVLRRRKSEVLQELPEKSEDKSYCDLSKEQYALYQECLFKDRDELIAQLRDRESRVNYLHVFALLSRLKQICNHPALVEKDPRNYKKYESGKWDLFVELLEEARESEQKVVVFSQYLYMLDIIENYLKERKWGYAQIRGDTVNRREELRRFQEDPDCLVFIGSLQAAGLGIDLTAASVVIMYDRWWNAARENQAIDRVHRIGQKWGVQVYKLITKGTIEEKIDKMITRKGQLLEDIVAADDQSVLKKFSRSELIDLLSYHEPEI